jgi:hypothetical protein
MNLNDVLCKLELTEFCEALFPGWEEAQAARPEQLFFLTPEFLADVGDWCSLPEEAMQAAVAAAGRIAASPELSALAWYLHYSLYRDPAFQRELIPAWPPLAVLQPLLESDAGMLYLLVLVSGLPHLQTYHTAHEVPEQVSRDTLSDVNRYATLCLEQTGAWGLWGPDRINWLFNHFKGDLYRLGRLQFQFAPFGGKIIVFRSQVTGKVMALSQDGVRFVADGRLWSESREQADSGLSPAARGRVSASAARGREGVPSVWTSRLAIADAAITGNVITVLGHAKPEPVRLPSTEWQPALAPGDVVLSLHIPGGGRMDHEACGESMRSAAGFFPQHFPKRPFAAYCCSSWLLDTQLTAFVPPESNIARFQREMYLYPVFTSDDAILRPVYGEVPSFYPAPKNTSLQRAVSEFLEAGGQLKSNAGGSFILREDLDWGGEVYRRGLADPRALED